MQGCEIVDGPASVRQARISSANPRLRRRERQKFWVVIVGLAALTVYRKLRIRKVLELTRFRGHLKVRFGGVLSLVTRITLNRY
jgi:hypothetical protein